MTPTSTGEKIRDLRRRKDWTQQELAEACGLTKSLISKIERGQTGSAIATLSKIAGALGVTLSWLLQDDEDSPITVLKKADRKEIKAGEEIGYLYESLATSSSNMKIQPVLVRVLPENWNQAPYTHKEHEFIYVLSGEINLSYQGTNTHMSKGDTAYFDGRRPHVFLPANDQEAQILTIFISD